ncbi:right-handed parallel beta-helix repeat-containing protein [bacterium]|nr:right-handed parallel beta-helix repeat-containing protein [bacterium]
MESTSTTAVNRGRILRGPFVAALVHDNTVSHCIAGNGTDDGGGIAVDFNANGAQVYRNYLYDNGGRGIYVYNADECDVYSNICHGNDGGITVSCLSSGVETATGNQVYNNTLYHNYNGSPGGGTSGSEFDTEIFFGGYHANCSQNTFYNNILAPDGSGRCVKYYDYEPSGITNVCNYNLFYQASRM